MTVNIYCLKRPDTDEVFYVGQTEKTLEFRLSQHLVQKGSAAKYKVITELAEKGLKPTICLLETTGPENGDACEKKWIGRFISSGCCLLNSNSTGGTELVERMIRYMQRRPSLSVRKLEQRAGIPATSLSQALRGTRDLSHAAAEKLAIVLADYGFGDPEIEAME